VFYLAKNLIFDLLTRDPTVRTSLSLSCARARLQRARARSACSRALLQRLPPAAPPCARVAGCPPPAELPSSLFACCCTSWRGKKEKERGERKRNEKGKKVSRSGFQGERVFNFFPN